MVDCKSLTISAWFSAVKDSTGATDGFDIVDKHEKNFDRIQKFARICTKIFRLLFSIEKPARGSRSL